MIFFLAFITNYFGCENNKRSEYLPLIQEIYRIECEHIVKSGIDVNNTSFYAFRTIAFQEILKNPDRVLLQNYEDLNSKLASLMYTLDDEYKKEVENEMEKIYSKRCQ